MTRNSRKALDAFINPEDMAHITRQEFCDNMDEILERVSKEDMAFVISEEGKHDILICPFDWFDLDCFDDFPASLRTELLTLIQRNPDAAEAIDGVIRENLWRIDMPALRNLRDSFGDSLEAGEPDSAGQRLYAEVLDELRRRERAE